MMRLDRVFAACDLELHGQLLRDHGFDVKRPGEYVRLEDSGRARIVIDPDMRRSVLSVLLSYYPAYMKPVADLMAGSKEDEGFPCGPYLHPRGVGVRGKR